MFSCFSFFSYSFVIKKIGCLGIDKLCPYKQKSYVITDF